MTIKTPQLKSIPVLATMLLCVWASALGAEHDYYGNLPYPKDLVPGVDRNKVEQKGGPNAAGYQRRTVRWWPRKGQDIVDIPAGTPLRTWTRNKGQTDREALAGACRNWTTSDGETFQAHLIGFRGFGIETPDPRFNHRLAPAAVLRMENGERRAVMVFPPFHSMVSQEDHEFIYKIWQQAWKKLQATQTQDEYLPNDYRVKPDSLVIQTKHFTWVSDADTQHKTLWWMRPHEPEKQNAYRQGSLEFAENMWTHIEATGSSMPYWRRPKPWKKYSVLVRLAIDGGYAGGGFAACDLRDGADGPRGLGISHEWYHGHPGGGWSRSFFGESVCHGGKHLNVPGEVRMFSHNFCYPWRNVSCTQYQCPLWYFALGDNPNWGDGILSVAGCLASQAEPTAYHTIARLGQQRGLWKNGVKGFGDFFGEYAARMVTCDFVMQYAIRSKYGMPEISFLHPVYGMTNRYRIPNSEAPRMYGFNIVRLVPAEGAPGISVNLDGLHDQKLHSDWRACIVAVDGNGRARYSQLWNKGKLDFTLRPEDKHLWLTVAATPSALPRSPSGNCDVLLAGLHAPRYPWEVTLSGCKPGTPHRRQGDVINLDELYTLNNGNQCLDHSVKNEVPIPLTDADGPLAQGKLADMSRRISLAAIAQNEKIKSGHYNPADRWERAKVRVTEDLTRRVKFLQRNAKGHRHANGGGFVADSAHVAATAYVGPSAMVLDGARVEENACIHQYAVVYGPKTVIGGNAKIGGKAWVFGDITVGGNARIMESVIVTTISRSPIGRKLEIVPDGRAEIDGNVVLKGEHTLRLLGAKDQKLTGELVMDYTPGYNGTVGYYELIPGIVNLQSGTFQHGRIYGRQGLGDGADAAGLYANWQFDQPLPSMLEDSYVNNNGVLYGRPKFEDDGQHKCIVFNGKDQYAEAPPSVADFAELTIDVLIKRTGGNSGRLFDFGCGEDECFYLEITDSTATLIARHKGETYQVAASQAIPIEAWIRVRVEMDGSNASIYVDGMKVANGKFELRPREVFIGDRTVGNFIACGRNHDRFIEGRIDHFRIYREVHDDFDALDPPPLPLTQLQDWSEKDQQRADTWEARKKVAEAELNAGKHGQMLADIKRQHSALHKSAKLDALDARVKELAREKKALELQARDMFRTLPSTVKAEQEIKKLKEKADALMSPIRVDSEFTKLTESVRTCELQRTESEEGARNSSKVKELSAKMAAANGQRQKMEQRIRQLPELKNIAELAEQENDSQKKRLHLERYNRLFQAKRLSDLQWQLANIVYRRVEERRRVIQRKELASHVGLAKKKSELQRLKKILRDLTARLRRTHPELSKLDESVRAKQNDLTTARRLHEEKQRDGNDYKQAEEAYAAARKALGDEKTRLLPGKNPESAQITANIDGQQEEANTLRDHALKMAGVAGRNPFAKRDAVQLRDFQQNLIYHSTADWDHRIKEELSGDVTATMKKWLLRVRGFYQDN